MRVLVTGATGFLGREVVAALLRRGHEIRVLIREPAQLEQLEWRAHVEPHRGDLRRPASLEGIFSKLDALVHLGVSPAASGAELFATAVTGTENLLEAMSRSEARRLILAGSLSVYDIAGSTSPLTEASPLEVDPYGRDEYVVAKVWQERVARRYAVRLGLGLTVLRPGLIWGGDSTFPAALGLRAGRVLCVFGARTTLPLTYVKNCADCFAVAATNPAAIGETFNVVDGHDVTAWRYAGEYLRATRPRGVRIAVPYAAARLLVHGAFRGVELVLGPGPRLPSALVPRRFEARFKPLAYSTQKLRDVLGWSPRWTFDEAIEQTFAAASLTR